MKASAGICDSLIAHHVPEALAQRLAAYGDLVLRFNRTMNLTAAREPGEFAWHILDALTLAHDVDGPLIDMGSGAGLPGVPLAIATGQPVTLVDSARKKAEFLKHVLSEFELAGEAVACRAESLGLDSAYRDRFQCATARAVSTAPTVAELTVPFLAIGGRALLQRGSMDDHERRAVNDAAPMLGADFIEERLLGGDLRVIILRKRERTPARFPRRDGIPDKRPLCM